MYIGSVDTERSCVRNDRDEIIGEAVESNRLSPAEAFQALSDDPRLGTKKTPWGNEWITMGWKGASDLTKIVQETYVDGNEVIATNTTTGTHEGGIMGIAPTGRSLEVDGVCVFHVEDRRLAETTDTWGAFGLFAQLGAFPEAV